MPASSTLPWTTNFLPIFGVAVSGDLRNSFSRSLALVRVKSSADNSSTSPPVDFSSMVLLGGVGVGVASTFFSPPYEH